MLPKSSTSDSLTCQGPRMCRLAAATQLILSQRTHEGGGLWQKSLRGLLGIRAQHPFSVPCQPPPPVARAPRTPPWSQTQLWG